MRHESNRHSSNPESLTSNLTEQLRRTALELARSEDATIELIGDLLALKDGETAAHSKRVTAYTIGLCRAMSLSAARIRVIACGALLHDIGVIALPDSIRRKFTPLTPEETVLMQTHCLRGYEVLCKIPFLAEAAEIVYAHEEHYDGSGFPRGLKGEKIPLGARIFAVVHALDAAACDGPRRAVQPVASAREEIARLAGTHFDPQVVRVFLQMGDQVWEDLRKEIDSQKTPNVSH